MKIRETQAEKGDNALAQAMFTPTAVFNTTPVTSMYAEIIRITL